MRRRTNLLMRMLRYKSMGFLCGLALFLGSFALAGGDVVINQWGVEKVLIPLGVTIIGAVGWFVRSIDRRLSDLSKGVNGMGQRLSHIEGHLGLRQTSDREG